MYVMFTWKVQFYFMLSFTSRFLVGVAVEENIMNNSMPYHLNFSNTKPCSEVMCVGSTNECSSLRNCQCSELFSDFLMTCSNISLPLTVNRKYEELSVSCSNSKRTTLNYNELIEVLNVFTSLHLESLTVHNCCGSEVLNLEDENYSNKLKITRLSLENCCLNSVQGNLSPTFVQVTELNLSNNNLSNLTLFNSLVNTLIIDKNQFETLERSWFETFKELTLLSLNENFLTVLPEDVFSDIIYLRILRLSSNRLTKLSATVFRQNEDLETLDLSNNELLELPSDLLLNLQFMKIISLKSNHLKIIPETFLKGLTELKEVYLQNNYIEYISDNFFQDNLKLEIIRLDNNRLKEMPEIMRPYFVPPLEINLSRNNIKVLELPIIIRIQAATKLDMSNNCFSDVHINNFTAKNNYGSMVQNFACVNCCLNHIHPLLSHKLEGSISLSHNLLSEVNNAMMETLLEFGNVDLSYNNIQYINISSDPTSQPKFTPVSGWRPEINLNFNPIICDCNLKSFLYFIQNGIPFRRNEGSLYFNNAELKCSKPDSLAGEPLQYLHSSNLLCNVEKDCPEKCVCSRRASDNNVLVNCRQKNLKHFPDVLPSDSLIHLDLSLNEISVLPSFNNSVWFKLTFLNLSGNGIESLMNLTVSANLEELYLDNNKLRHFEPQIENIFSSKTLEFITLENNPWVCNCALIRLKYLIQNTTLNLNRKSMFCSDERKEIFIGTMNENHYCSKTLFLDTFINILLPLLIVIVLCLGIIIYFGWKFRGEIKLWLFIHGWFLHFVTEKDIDQDKIYDAFISYSSKDVKWVAESLVPGLESGPPSYKLCLHDRDWPLGGWIIEEITNSVRQSRRTIIVLTENFLQSTWSRMEFAAASQQSLRDHMTRVLVVVPGEVPNLELMDEEFKTFITMNTYLKWDNPHFWRKLRCAMPMVREN